ncbi:MAG: extracellular solute-binding protein [Pseudomonadota bacterium]
MPFVCSAALRFLSRCVGCCVAGTAVLAAAPGFAQVSYFTWADLDDPPFFTEHLARGFAPPAVTIFADEDEAFAKLRAGFRPDVMGPCLYEIPRWRQTGLIQPIEVAQLTHWDSLSAAMKDMAFADAATVDTPEGHVWFVPQFWGETSVLYRADLLSDEDLAQGWEILWDPKYAGRTSALPGAIDTVTFVAHTLGIDPYAMDETAWGQVQDKLRALVGHVRLVSSDPTVLQQALASGEVVAAMSWNSDFIEMKKDGHDVDWMRPDAGVFTWVCGLTLGAAVEDPAAVAQALSLIDSSLSEGAGRYMVQDWGYGAANIRSYEGIDPAVHARNGLPADVETFLRTGIFQKRIPDSATGRTMEDVIRRWEEIKAGL